MAERLRVLVVDDVAPALDDLCGLLRDSPCVREVVPAADAVTALRLIQTADRDGPFDAAFLDISMPGMDGLELGSLLSRLADPPEIVFVTAFEEPAVSAYGVGALDYLLKPVSTERLDGALARIRRVAGASREGEPAGVRAAEPVDQLAAVPVELAGRTRWVRRDDVRFVEAQGDYVRLHTSGGSHLLRMPISRLEEHWADHGYTRVHRSFLLDVSSVLELRSDSGGGLLAHTDAGDVPVSRRHARALRDLLLDAATRGDLRGAR